MYVPSLLGVAMYILDVRFHFFLIFPSREWHMAEISFTMPGAGLWLKSVWIAMCVELYFRELIFLVRLKQERWMRNI